jgi:hypothetical protein
MWRLRFQIAEKGNNNKFSLSKKIKNSLDNSYTPYFLVEFELNTIDKAFFSFN